MQNKILHRINFIFIFLAINILSAQHIFSQDASFTNSNDEFYFHKIAETDFSSINPSEAYWNQSIVADKNYIYIADNSKNNLDTKDTSKTYLTVKRFSAIDGSPAEDLVYTNANWDFDYIEDDCHSSFYLVDCHDDEHFLIFLNTPENGIDRNKISFNFFLVDKYGRISKEYITDYSKLYITGIRDGVARIGVPAINGDIMSGKFKLIVPIVDYDNHLYVLLYQYGNNIQTSVNVMYYNTANAYTKPVISIIDDKYYLLDDICTEPILLPYYTTAGSSASDVLSFPHVKANGVHFFSANGHNFLVSGNLQFADEADITTGASSYDIGALDGTVTPASRATDSEIDFSNYKHMISIPTGKSIIESNNDYMHTTFYAYRQFAATSDFGDATHVHLYTPGQSLVTYQLNKNSIPTSISDIAVPSDFDITLRDRILLFSRPTSGINIYDIAGRLITNQECPTDKLSLQSFTAGVYIIKTPLKTQKIILK